MQLPYSRSSTHLSSRGSSPIGAPGRSANEGGVDLPGRLKYGQKGTAFMGTPLGYLTKFTSHLPSTVMK
jgi:hypothetical protein